MSSNADKPKEAKPLFASSDLKEWGWLEWLIVGGSLFLLLVVLIGTIVGLARANRKLKQNFRQELLIAQDTIGQRYFPAPVATADVVPTGPGLAPRGEYMSPAQALRAGKTGGSYGGMPTFGTDYSASNPYGSVPQGVQRQRSERTFSPLIADEDLSSRGSIPMELVDE